VTSTNTGAIVELFDGGWLPLEEGLPRVRVIVARHLAPDSDTAVTVGKRRDEWVYELFMTTLGVDRFLVEDVLDLYHGRGAFEGVLADEDIEGDPDRWCSSAVHVGKNCGKRFATGYGTCGWPWDTCCRAGNSARSSGRPLKKRPLFSWK
jgi:hypothetical protein